MPLSIDVNDAAQAVLQIADAEGELHLYRFALAERGLSLWALSLTRADTEASYLVTEEVGGKWTCDCRAEKYRKRGKEPCKHIQAVKLLRAWLRTLGEHHERGRNNGDRNQSRRAV